MQETKTLSNSLPSFRLRFSPPFRLLYGDTRLLPILLGQGLRFLSGSCAGNASSFQLPSFFRLRFSPPFRLLYGDTRLLPILFSRFGFAVPLRLLCRKRKLFPTPFLLQVKALAPLRLLYRDTRLLPTLFSFPRGNVQGSLFRDHCWAKGDSYPYHPVL